MSGRGPVLRVGQAKLDCPVSAGPLSVSRYKAKNRPLSEVLDRGATMDDGPSNPRKDWMLSCERQSAAPIMMRVQPNGALCPWLNGRAPVRAPNIFSATVSAFEFPETGKQQGPINESCPVGQFLTKKLRYISGLHLEFSGCSNRDFPKLSREMSSLNREPSNAKQGISPK